MRSGELAAAAGVTVETLRYYERRGLLPVPVRSTGGHRAYEPEALTLLRVIKAAQRLGFTLDEIAGLVALGTHRGPRPGLRSAAVAKLADVEARIADLEAVRSALQDVIAAGCADLVECSCVPDCPVPFEHLAR